MAAWGIKPGANQAGAQAGAQTGAQNGAQNGAQASKPAPAKTGPQFDYVYQVAAFKSDEDADKLRTRLEGKGLHTRTQKSGKLVLVLVNMRQVYQWMTAGLGVTTVVAYAVASSPAVQEAIFGNTIVLVLMRRQFRVPALAPLIYNGAIIAVGLLLPWLATTRTAQTTLPAGLLAHMAVT